MWAAVRDRWRALGHRYEEAYAEVRWSEAKLAAGSRREAKAALRRCASVAQELGAAPLAAFVADVRLRAGLDAAAQPVEDGLTPREREILSFVAVARVAAARGLLGPDASARLFPTYAVLRRLKGVKSSDQTRISHLRTANPASGDGGGAAPMRSRNAGSRCSRSLKNLSLSSRTRSGKSAAQTAYKRSGMILKLSAAPPLSSDRAAGESTSTEQAGLNPSTTHMGDLAAILMGGLWSKGGRVRARQRRAGRWSRWWCLRSS
jgi:hypothetical protein